jgi:DNA-binding transcriptional MerR regulator
MGHTVGEVARLAGVSVRTLHHYDEIGLLMPPERSDSGYRIYGERHLADLQQVLFFKELGFGLEQIRRIMRDPSFDRREALEIQRGLLAEKAAQMTRMVGAVDAALGALERGTPMDEKDMFEVFGDFDPKEYEAEAAERWGDTDAYEESARRTKRYTKDDWKKVLAEADAISAAIVAIMDDGVPADGQRAMGVAEQHRLQIDRRFYPCSLETHVGLAEMYVADPRFTANYEKIHPGMARYLCDAIKANAARHS